jgi:hypothetical protein
MNTRLGVSPLIASIILMSAFIHFPFSYAQTNQTNQEWLTYEDPILGISIQYPKGWEPIEEPNTLLFNVYENETSPVLLTTVEVAPTLGLNTSEDVMKSYLNTPKR